ncbi:MAG: hypothetical protein AAFX06_27580 [Planctomycetota bacterium]
MSFVLRGAVAGVVIAVIVAIARDMTPEQSGAAAARLMMLGGFLGLLLYLPFRLFRRRR